ncbi:MAG: MFS transporter [Nitrospinota bacterium]|nr:MFS transporter [Nitrospinota bacterium]
MSTIVVVRKNGRAVIASDSLNTYGSIKQKSEYTIGEDKIFEGRGSWFGVTGWAVCAQVLQDVLSRKEIKLNFSSRDKIFTSLRKLHPILKKQYYLMTQDSGEGEQPFESSQIRMLIANPEGIFEAWSWREVAEYTRFWAIGSGQKYALGAMHALYDRIDSAEEIARAGAQAGAEFDDGSDMPVLLRELKLKKDKPK